MKCRILLVDDDEDNLGSNSLLLRDDGHDITEYLYRTTPLPSGYFDKAIIDGLKGAWEQVADELGDTCEIIIFSGDPYIVKAAKELDYKTFHTLELQKLREYLKK